MRLFNKKKTVSTHSASDTQVCNELTENVECNLVSKIRTAQDSLDEVQKRIDELSSMQRYLHSEMWKLFLDVDVYRTLYASGRKQPGEHITAKSCRKNELYKKKYARQNNGLVSSN